MNSEQLAACNTKSWAAQFGILFGANEQSSKCTDSSLSVLNGRSNGQVTVSVVTKGSRLTSSISEWSSQDFTPAPTHFQLAPIVNLLSDRQLKDQTGLKLDAPRLRSWFVAMYYNYCKVMRISCEGEYLLKVLYVNYVHDLYL